MNLIKSTSLILLLLFSNIVLGQLRRSHIYREPIPEDDLRSHIHNECSFSNKYSIRERLNKYPFNKAAKVMLISFHNDHMNSYIPIKNKTLLKDLVVEQTTLNNERIDSLTTILYNVGYTPIKQNPDLVSLNEHGCYQPRNGILFISVKGEVFEYIEICFSCQGRRRSSKRFDDGDYCDNKYALLKDFFADVGITHGVKDRNTTLSYREIAKLDTLDMMNALSEKFSDRERKRNTLRDMNDTERTLFYAMKARIIYDYGRPCGFTLFYSDRFSGELANIIIALREIGAMRSASALKKSVTYWPKMEVPKTWLDRRKTLLRIVNKVDKKWQKLADDLYYHKNLNGGLELTPKEDIDELILNYMIKRVNKLNG